MSKRVELAIGLVLAVIGIFQPERIAWALLVIAALLLLSALWRWLGPIQFRGRIVVSCAIPLTALVYLGPAWLDRGRSKPVAQPVINEEVVERAAKRGAEEALKATNPEQPKTHAATSAIVPPQRLLLYDRDPESWKGHRYGEGPLKLDESTVLEMPVGPWQRFNPQLITPEALFGVNVFVILPRQGIEVQPTKIWRETGGDVKTVQYWATFGEVNPGIIQGVDEALHFRVSAPMSFNVAYVVSARGERSGGIQPKPVVLRVEAK